MKRAKTTKRTARAKTRKSEIIDQCVVYAQALCAFSAGFDIDPTGNSDYAGSDQWARFIARLPSRR